MAPQTTGGPEFGDLFQEIIVNVEKEGNLGGESIHGKTDVHGRLHIADAISQGEG